jgi:branched-subunit amino acid ABC-type transport system permease component
MRTVAIAIGALVMVAGLALIVAPGAVVILAPAILTPRGLLLVAAARIAIGLLMLRVAAGARSPRVVQVLGIIVLIDGVATPFFGAVRARVLMAWWVALGPRAIRAVGVLVVLLGGCIAYFVSARRPIES